MHTFIHSSIHRHADFLSLSLSLACLLACKAFEPGGRPPEPRALALRFSPSVVSVIHEAQLFCGMARSHAHPMQHSQAHPRLGQSACAEPLFKEVFASFPDIAGLLARGSGEKPLSETTQRKQCNLSCSLGSSWSSCLDSVDIGTGLWLTVAHVGTSPLGKSRRQGPNNT